MARWVKEGLYNIEPVRVADIPSRQRPREQFERMGAESVPEDVLIALILRSGVQGMNVVDLARGLIQQYGTLTELARASVEDLSRMRGMGKVKAQVLKAALELAKRLSAESAPTRNTIRTPGDAAGVLELLQGGLPRTGVPGPVDVLLRQLVANMLVGLRHQHIGQVGLGIIRVLRVADPGGPVGRGQGVYPVTIGCQCAGAELRRAGHGAGR